VTVVAISHQPALLAVADRVFRLDGGAAEPTTPAHTGSAA
jgi:hypothetical protein